MYNDKEPKKKKKWPGLGGEGIVFKEVISKL